MTEDGVGYLLVMSEADPVGRAVHGVMPAGQATGGHVDGASIRSLAPGVWVLARSQLHIHDEDLPERLPVELRERRPALIFPSIHKSESGVPCFTVHPLGNWGGVAEVGGAPRTLTPSAPRLMTDALRRLSDVEGATGLRATYEATHHGPRGSLPAFFAEIGYGARAEPPAEAVRALSRVLTELSEDPGDRIAVAVGGGHYAPHFTDLALRRHWAFGHIVSRHSLLATDPATAGEAMRRTPGAEGAVYVRAADRGVPSTRDLRPVLRETFAPRRAGEAPDES